MHEALPNPLQQQVAAGVTGRQLIRQVLIWLGDQPTNEPLGAEKEDATPQTKERVSAIVRENNREDYCHNSDPNHTLPPLIRICTGLIVGVTSSLKAKHISDISDV